MKKIKVIVFVLLFFPVISLNILALNDDNINEIKESYENSMLEGLSDETLDILEESGFNSIDFESILNSQPKDIISFFVNSAKGTINGPLKNLALTSGILIGISICFSYLPNEEKRKKAINTFACVYVAISVSVPVSSLLSAGSAAISMSSRFMIVFLPILAGLLAACNNPILALNYNSLTLYMAEAISTFASNILVPFTGMFFALVSIGTVAETMRINSIASVIKSSVTKVLSLLSAIFVGVLSIKGILSNMADTVAVKGAKLLVSSLVPVIGGAMSEAYGTIVNSLSLLKSTVGVFGIIIIAAVNLPVIVELTMWSISLTVSCVVADVLDLKTISKYLKDVSSVIKTFNIILIFCCMLFIVSTGILLTIRAGV